MVMAGTCVQSIINLGAGAFSATESAAAPRRWTLPGTVTVTSLDIPNSSTSLHSASLTLKKWERFPPSTKKKKKKKGVKGLLMGTRAMYVDDDDEGVAVPMAQFLPGQCVDLPLPQLGLLLDFLSHSALLKLQGYLIDAPISIGDGFSFSGGKYSADVGRGAEWFKSGQIAKAYPVEGGLEKAKDPLFGLPMGEASQSSNDFFRWFFVEEGDRSKPSVLLLHGFPSQAYSYRKVMQLLSSDYHVVAVDWLGFGFSDKPQAKYGFNYTADEYAAGLALLVETLDLKTFTLVAQGFFAPAVVQFAKENPSKVDHLILINPPVTEQHVKLPSALSAFSTFLLGEIFAQDPLKASDKPLSECGPYILDEEDAEVYRRPYLTSGSSGFALTALSRVMKSELKGSVPALRKTLTSDQWTKPISIIWGLKDRWLDFKGVEEFSRLSKARLVQLPEVGHHAQEDWGEEVGGTIKSLLRRTVVT